ncbi:Tryprostatin B 6-hydroxylase 1 [Colletotrichum chlorophyti]|uniref:Tryprostatin B 6-hydroxylase 1 n=1 Tax=Colletotrichum chlorophyti TaxID=708187 RepID=A0A1Q8S6W1_9PEZI|nr:Tryprostatin B 6-hydroxylase 1 [Colletotrichum chlorophyti]
MTESQNLQTHSLFFGLGICIHIFAFRVGEWDLSTTRLMWFFAFGITLLTSVLINSVPRDLDALSAAAKASLSLTSTLIMGIYVSLLVTRPVSPTEPLSGAFACTIFKFLHHLTGYQKFKIFIGDMEILSELAQPSCLSTTRKQSCRSTRADLLARKARGTEYWTQYTPYNSFEININMLSGEKPLKDYEFRVADYTNQLLLQIDAHLGQPFDLADWFNFYSFDVMGDLAFGKSFGMLRDGIKHYFMNCLHTDMQNIGRFSHMLWLFPIFKNTPILNANNKRFWKFVTSQVDERIKNSPDRPDVFSWILQDYKKIQMPTRQDTLNFYGDAYLIIVAGSDTTAASLTCLFFELAQKPLIYERLREEIDNYFAQHTEPEHSVLSRLPYLQACIDEALRLHPPVPSGLQRITPPEGMEIDGTIIPGDTIVRIPTYTMQRDERCFPRADEFIPERWISRPELAADPAAFAPFGIGRYSCVGKQLGLMEIRYCVSQIVHRYNVAFSSGQTSKAFVEGKKDGFTLSLPELEVIFERREAGAHNARE